MEASKSYREMTVEELVNAITNDGTGKSGKSVSYKTCDSVSYLAMLNDCELQELEGVGKKRAEQIRAAIELGSRLRAERRNLKKITSAYDCRDMIWDEVRNETVENMWVFFLRNNNSVICKKKIATGGISWCCVDVRLILREALSCLATGLILVHNHPSGNARPSFEDARLTEKIEKAAQVMDIRLVDHVILTNEENTYYSFNEDGKL